MSDRVPDYRGALLALGAFLRTQDPRNATERYELIANEFEAKHHRTAPGRSRPPELGAEPFSEETHRLWRTFCNSWHEARFDEAHATLEVLGGAHAVCVDCGELREDHPEPGLCP